MGRTSTSRRHPGTATITILTDEWVRLDFHLSHGGISDSVEVLATEGAPGTQWLYIQVPAVNLEWHPFSLAGCGPSVVIKAAGDWTRRLHQVTSETPESSLPVSIDGVFGNACPPWRPYARVLLIGGGVGVTPWLPMMTESLAGNEDVPHASLVWVARDGTWSRL